MTLLQCIMQGKYWGIPFITQTAAMDAIKDADALFLLTEWNEFKQLDLAEITKLMKQPIIFDGRNCFNEDNINLCEKIEYYPVGKMTIIK